MGWIDQCLRSNIAITTQSLISYHHSQFKTGLLVDWPIIKLKIQKHYFKDLLDLIIVCLSF